MRHQSFLLERAPSSPQARVGMLFLAIGILSPLGSAQWFAVSLHPAGNSSSHANGGDAGTQSGYTIIGGVQHAAEFGGTTHPWIDLHPAAATASEALDSHNNVQVGWARVGGVEVASLWGGSAASWANLNPPGALSSRATGCDLGDQAGFVEDSNHVVHAAVWHGSSASYVDLMPANANSSAVWGMRSTQQAGQASIIGQGLHAGTWNGSANTWIDLHPAGAIMSQAWGTDGVQAVGRAVIGGVDRASLWSGSAASWIDLTPSTSFSANAYAVDAGEQVGQDNNASAFFWAGSASSAFNLGAIMPPNFNSSRATAIWHSGGHAFVLGTAQNSLAGNREEVMLWQRLIVTTYCTAKVNSQGCTPSIEAFGTSSATATNGFYIRTLHMRNNTPGLLLYSNAGRAAVPFTGGTLCIHGPLRRSPGLSSGGLGNGCNGIFVIDVNAFRAGTQGGNPAPYLSVAGTLVNCQFWGRDPGFSAPDNTQLSNALEFEIGP